MNQKAQKISEIIEDYNEDDDIPFIPAMPQKPNMSNPEKMGNNQAQQQYVVPQFSKEPNLQNAYKNKDRFDAVLNKINQSVDSSLGIKTPNNTQKIEQTIEILTSAVEMLQKVDNWIPDGKEECIAPLKKIAEPIANALKAYVSKIQQFC